MIPLCKLRKNSVFLFGTQCRKIVTDKSGNLKVEVAMAVEDCPELLAAYKTVPDYLNQNALK